DSRRDRRHQSESCVPTPRSHRRRSGDAQDEKARGIQAPRGHNARSPKGWIINGAFRTPSWQGATNSKVGLSEKSVSPMLHVSGLKWTITLAATRLGF